MLLDRISEITQRWFLSEEALFSIFCTHKVEENRYMKCLARVGKGVIEVNPILCDDITDKALEEYLRVELIRILLKHPYERQPEGCSTLARALGSNCVIGCSYKLQHMEIEHPSDFNLPCDGHFEFYARSIDRLLQACKMPSDSEDEDNTGAYGNPSTTNNPSCPKPPCPKVLPLGSSAKATADLAERWEQDELMEATVNDVIRNIQSWGSLAGRISEEIIASTKARIDYRNVLSAFRATVLSQSRRLTRMRPNRRSGFNAMGSRYDFTTRMIIGVDVSGSISKRDLQHFYSTINRFFQYGIQQIDVVQFDTELREVETLTRAMQNIHVRGRGGTCFQPFIDYVGMHPEYDGAIIYTDGYAEIPSIPSNMHTPLCWILRSEQQLKQHEAWMRKSGKVCVIESAEK